MAVPRVDVVVIAAEDVECETSSVNTDGDVYVKFDPVSDGEKALQGLNGRNFDHRMIRASYVVDKIYMSRAQPSSMKD